MNITFHHDIINLAKILNKPLYAVGGIVRNALLGEKGGDIDLASPTDSEEFVCALENAGLFVQAVYKRTGTVMFRDSDGTHYEHTCFRSEVYGTGGQHTPIKTVFTDDICLDAIRRDFKCNAVYYDIGKGVLVDPLGGIEDIKNKVLDTVVAPKDVFCFDGLRLLRLCRFAGELGFEPTKEVTEGAYEYRNNIKDISPERIFDELQKILIADYKYSWSPKDGHYRGIKLCHKIGVLALILPELTLGENMPQRADFHSYDVLEHSLKSVLYADKSVRLACLLHDVGKPYSFEKHKNFYSHADDGEIIARKILERLKASIKLTEEVAFLVKKHMLDLDCKVKQNKVRRYIIESGEYFDKLLLVKQADFSACKDDLSQAPCTIKWKQIYDKMKSEGVPFTVKELKVNGEDMKKVGFSGKRVGEVLKKLFDTCIADGAFNDREKLIVLAEKTFAREKND